MTSGNAEQAGQVETAEKPDKAETDELEELANQIRRLIKSNDDFLKHVNDEDYDSDDEADESAGDSEEDLEDYEEL